MTLTPETADIAGLLPCPFCGGEAKHYEHPDHGGWSNTDSVSCVNEDCGCGTCLHDNKARATAAWNRRDNTALQSLSAELAEAKGEIDRLRDLLRDRPNTLLIAHEDGKQMRAIRALAVAEAKLAAMREALTPSGDTEAAYMGEFTIAVERIVNEDNEPDDETEGVSDPYDHVPVPWTTIKEIMAAIKVRALGGSNAE